MNAEKRLAIFKRLSAAIPNPSTELEHASTFELLIAVILSAQATDKGVNIATRKLFKVANTPEAIFHLGIEGLEFYIKTIGLYHAKAKNVIACCAQLIQQHNSEVPNTREALEALPGVGRKTANVILNTAFGQPTIAVDTHLFRLGNRTKFATGKNVLEVEQKYLKTIPIEFLHDAHHLLILHGRYTCTARNPKCGECCIVDLCEFKDKVIPTIHLMAGEAMAKSSRAGEAMTESSRAGEAMTESSRAGEAMTESSRAGEAMTEKSMAGEAMTEKSMAGQGKVSKS